MPTATHPAPLQTAQVPSSQPLRLMLGIVVLGCVLIYAVAEGAMISQFWPDPQLPIWMVAYLVKILFWLFAGLAITWLVTVRRPRGLLALPLIVAWTAAILWSTSMYCQGWRALAVATDPSSAPAALTQLAHFQGMQAGYELDNRLAANPSTPIDVLRELHGRKDQSGTEMCLAANPKTPPEILHEFGRSEDPWIRRQLATNPALDQELIERLKKDTDPQVRERLAINPQSSVDRLRR